MSAKSGRSVQEKGNNIAIFPWAQDSEQAMPVIKEVNQVEYNLAYILLQENYVFPSKIITNVLDQQF